MSAPPTQIRIDIVSDVVCPWCIIGYKQLQEALSRLDGEVDADVHWHPFELNPMMPPQGQELREHIGEKYGTNRQQSDAARARLTALGDSLGFSFNFYEGQRIYNTFLAHQLLAWAAEHHKQSALEMALFESYFSNQENVGDEKMLASVAGRVGLDEIEAAALLEDGRYAADVREHQRFWLSKGIQAVPSFILDRRYLVSGAQDPDVFVAAFEKLTEEATALQPANSI
ncbi:MAG: DsbA family oxidoreductase [Myxococcales bacterium]|nr:DsbA family oxidoreductase [Deltaproteobacteria bacterium]NNE19300.1 DsbA family oxidoreductase [Myxococcales bacterium]